MPIEPYWTDGTLTLYLGDARAVLPQLDVHVTLVLTDPPYGISKEGSKARGPKKDRNRDYFTTDRDLAQARELVRAVVPLAKQLTLVDGSAYWWASDKIFGDVLNAYMGIGWETRHYVWFKGDAPPPMPDCPWSTTELCVYAYPERRVWNWGTDNPPPRSMIAHNKVPADGTQDHPNRKPVDVMRTWIKGSTAPGDLVLDPFAGSGRTLEAARLEGRRAVGIELDERSCDIAVQRLSQTLLPFHNIDGAHNDGDQE